MRASYKLFAIYVAMGQAVVNSFRTPASATCGRQRLTQGPRLLATSEGHDLGLSRTTFLSVALGALAVVPMQQACAAGAAPNLAEVKAFVTEAREAVAPIPKLLEVYASYPFPRAPSQAIFVKY